MTIGRRLTADATVPLRKVRAATAEALDTIDQHAAVINGQKQRLEAYGAQLADLVEWARGMERRVLELEARVLEGRSISGPLVVTRERTGYVVPQEDDGA